MTQNEDEATKELLRRFKEYHCEDSLAELFAKYKPLVIRAINSFHFRTLDRDDLLQEKSLQLTTPETDKTIHHRFMIKLSNSFFTKKQT